MTGRKDFTGETLENMKYLTRKTKYVEMGFVKFTKGVKHGYKNIW